MPPIAAPESTRGSGPTPRPRRQTRSAISRSHENTQDTARVIVQGEQIEIEKQTLQTKENKEAEDGKQAIVTVVEVDEDAKEEDLTDDGEGYVTASEEMEEDEEVDEAKADKSKSASKKKMEAKSMKEDLNENEEVKKGEPIMEDHESGIQVTLVDCIEEYLEADQDESPESGEAAMENSRPVFGLKFKDGVYIETYIVPEVEADDIRMTVIDEDYEFGKVAKSLRDG